ncbi:MAG: right-handed parallel beta-helix repeat-containing protein, partial [Cyanobacteria bacterium P01_H01_bin.15]
MSIVSILVTSQWLLPSAVSAAQYYVHANKGKNSNSGTSPTKAFGDLSHALKQLRAGDTLHVRSGTYNSIPQLSPGIVRSGTGSQPIVLKAYGNERPIISGSNTIRLNGGISNWVIQGLTFNNASAVKLGVRNGNTTNCMSYADNITIKNNIFQNNSDGGIVLNCARNIKIENNDFFNLRSRKVGSDTHAILMTAQVSNATISGNQFTDIGADGVQMAGNIRNVAITDNTFEIVHPYRYRGLNGQVDSSNSKRFGSVGENAIDIKAGPGPFTITGNTIRGFRPVIKGTQDASGDMGVGIVLHQTSKKVFIRRNYFHDNVIHINMGTASAGSQVSHNIFDSTSQAESVYGSDTQIPKALLLKGVNGIDVYNNVFHNDSAQDKFLLRTVGADNILLQNNVFQNGRLWPTDTRYMKADYNAFSGITKDLDGMFKGPHDVSGSLRLNGSTWKPNSGSPLI